MVLPWAIFLLGLRPAFARNRLLVYNVSECYLAGFAPSLLVTVAGAILGCFIKIVVCYSIGKTRSGTDVPWNSCSSVAINVTHSLKNNYLTTNKTEETIEVSMRMNASVLRTKQFYRHALEVCKTLSCSCNIGDAWCRYSNGTTRNGTGVPWNSVLIRCDKYYMLIKDRAKAIK